MIRPRTDGHGLGLLYPTARADAALQSGQTIPVLGDVLLYTAAPIISRLLWSAMVGKIFAPAPIPEKFNGFPAK